MRSFIYDQYGYILESDANSFSYMGYDFKLVAHDYEEIELRQLEETEERLLKELPYEAKCHLVLSRNNEFRTENEFGAVSLVTAPIQEYQPLAVFKLMELGSTLKSKEDFSVSRIIDLWEEKLSLMEMKYMEASKIDDYLYPLLYTETLFAIGLANNAISYLVDIKNDFGDEISRLYLSHKRLPDLKAITLFDPFNLILDSPERDIAFLYELHELSVKGVLDAISYFKLDQKEVSLLIARLLFPRMTFDLLEDQYNIKKDIKKDLAKQLGRSSNDLIRLKELFLALSERFSLRPIKWILDQ